jgi:hypothetical protein
MKLGKTRLKLMKYPKLVDLYRHIFKQDIKQEHRTTSDCEICAKCYFNL